MIIEQRRSKISFFTVVVFLIISCDNSYNKYSQEDIHSIVKVKPIFIKKDKNLDFIEFYYENRDLTNKEYDSIIIKLKEYNINYLTDKAGNIYFFSSSICKFNCEYAMFGDIFSVNHIGG